jgi:uncharacterized membrane protein YeaQ/YmgE (transglycosylase-associated protein family)
MRSMASASFRLIARRGTDRTEGKINGRRESRPRAAARPSVNSPRPASAIVHPLRVVSQWKFPAGVSMKTLMSLKGYSHARRSGYLSRRKPSGDEGGNGVGLISWIAVGLMARVLAKWIMPVPGPGGLFITILLGMGGAAIGGFVAGLLGRTGATGFNVWSSLVAMLGAIILLFLHGLIARRPV